MRKFFTFALAAFFVLSLNAQQTGLASRQQSPKQKSDNSPISTITKKTVNFKSAKATNFINESFATEIPATWTVTTLQGIGWFYDDGTTHTYGQGCAMIDSDASGGMEEGYLTSPTVDASGAASLILEYNYNFQKYSTTEPDSGWVEVYNGTSWVVVSSYHADSPNEGPQFESIDVTAYANANFAVRFGYLSDYCWYFEISDVVVYEPDANDVGAYSIDFGSNLPNAFDPKATFKNYGSSNQTFDVTMNITPGGYTSTQTITALGASATQQVTFANWNPSVGTYQVEIYTSLATDSDHTNDTLRTSIDIINVTYTPGTLYGYNAYGTTLDQHIVTVDKTTAALGDLALSTTNDFLACGDYIDGTIYGVEYGTNDLYIVNGDGATLLVGTISGVTSITGIAYDATNDVVYLADYDGAASILFTLDMNTLVATSVGEISTNLIIAIAAGNNGEVWGIDITTSHFWNINTSTGAGTDVGALGATISYAQDMGFDRENAILYGTLYTTSGELYTIDVTTGVATLIAAFTDEVSMCAIASDKPVSITELSNNISIYPNPAENNITITTNGTSLVTISDLAGRVVFSSQISGTENISVAGFNAGVYVVRSENSGNVETTKLIVR